MRNVVNRFFREFGRWRTVHDTGVWRYQENTATGRRRILRVNWNGYQPIDYSWLEGQFSPSGEGRGGSESQGRRSC